MYQSDITDKFPKNKFLVAFLLKLYRVSCSTNLIKEYIMFNSKEKKNEAYIQGNQ
jgi:hypothetical protein